MANINSLDGLDELLAEIYETLKRHEQVLHALTVDVEGLKAWLPDAERERFQQAREKILHEVAFALDRQSHLYDVMISRLRDT